MGGTRYITQKALHGMSAQRTVSIQEAVHMVDSQDLVICSEKFTYLSLRQGAILTSEKDGQKRKDVVTMYRNRSKNLANISLDEYFYSHFCREVLKEKGDRTDLTKHRILLPVGQNCKPRYPVKYDYAKGVLIQYRPWSTDKPLTKILSSSRRTISMFKCMMDNKEFPTCVTNQYILAMKYSRQAKLELLNSKSVQQPYNLTNMDEEEQEACIAHQHVTHFSDNKHHSKVIDGMTVDIGTQFDWSETLYKERRQVSVDGTLWVNEIRSEHDSAVKDQAGAVDKLVLPKQRNGKDYDAEELSDEQKAIVYNAVDTVVKFLNNDSCYKPMRATIMGSAGTGKSFVINTIISMVRRLTGSNDTVQVGAPSGAAAFNVQGSTIHNLLGVRVTNPEKDLTENTKSRLLEQLERLLVLVIDERSMISSKVLAAAERNTRECIFRGQNSSEIWGGLPVVLLFGDDYQLMPVDKNGAINGYDKRCCGADQYVTDKMSQAQLFAYQGDRLFTDIMTDQVFFLTKNFRVGCKNFKHLLERVRVGRTTAEDANKMMKLHHVFYSVDKEFKHKVENHEKTMWLFSNNSEVRRKNIDKLVEVSTNNNVPVARLKCWYDTNKTQGGKQRSICKSHFEANCYRCETDVCVGARVALRNWNILPCAGLYNGSIGTVVEIVYRENPIGPNDKQHNHLPDYVVVDFPHLKLPSYIEPWDKLRPTVRSK